MENKENIEEVLQSDDSEKMDEQEKNVMDKADEETNENVEEICNEETQEEQTCEESCNEDILEEETEQNVEESLEDDANNEDSIQKEMDELKLKNNNLKDENKKFKNELEVLKERLLRVTAEYDNFRNRTEKEKKGIYTDACGDVLNTLLPIYDNLERAIMAEGSADDIKLGVEAVTKQYIECLKKLDVEEIDTNCEFDPNYHNAIMHIEDSDLGKNEIVEVFQKGFKRGDKVLRYSLVKVAN